MPETFVWLDGCDGSDAGRFSYLALHPLEEILGQSLAELALIRCRDEMPEWFGYISYDAVFSDPEVLGIKTSRTPLVPAFRFVRFASVYRFDATTKTWFPSKPPWHPSEAGACTTAAPTVKSTPTVTHQARVRELLEHIRDGDVYQANLARRFCTQPLDATQLYLRMRAASPVPFGALLQYSDAVTDAPIGIASASMELFLHWGRTTNRLITRPIKGTIAQAPGAPDALRNSIKECAEHAMIVDLLRNDLSKVCTPGSVVVEDAFAIEPYRDLLHMVSTVAGTTRDNLALQELLQATFPPGSVTGTPKASAIEHIDRLEQQPRGAYCGAIGYIGAQHMYLSVAIRTAQCFADRTEYFAGGGIVYDSDPEAETAETELKAQVFLRALKSLRDEVPVDPIWG